MKRIGLMVLLFVVSLSANAYCDTAGNMGSAPEQSQNSPTILPSGRVFTFGQTSMDLWAGFATVNMSKFNTAMEDFNDAYMVANNYTDSQRLTKLSSGATGGLDLNFELAPGFKMGPRIEYLYVFPGEIYGMRDHHYPNGSNSPYTYEWTESADAMLIPITVGFSYTTQSRSAISFSFGLNIGLALAYAGLHSKYTTDDPNWATSLYRYDLPVSANGLFAKFLASMNFAMGPDSCFFIKLAYRLADYDSFTVDDTVRNSYPLGRVNEGSTARDFTGSSLDMDFSGLEAGLGFSFGI